MYTKKRQGYRILNGPNADRLIDAFKYAHGYSILSVSFEIEFNPDTDKTGEYECRICSVEHKDDSGHLFKIGGVFRNSQNTSFVGLYDAASRKGSIRLF